MNRNDRSAGHDNGRRYLQHGIDMTWLASADGATAQVADHGAHLVSWRPAGGDEALFLSAASGFGGKQAIRGGVPIIFPQFGARGPGQRHGFARLAPWQFMGAGSQDGMATGHRELRCNIDDDADRACLLRYTVCLAGDVIDLALDVSNIGTKDLHVHAALHTYLRVADRTTAWIDGLQKADFIDQVAENPALPPSDRTLTAGFTSEIDRIYGNAPYCLLLHDSGRTVEITQTGFADTVIWNPGAAKAAALDDLETGGDLYFVCIEAAAVLQAIMLAPDTAWRGTQRLRIKP